eukprot:COSAG02_NODE_789_length_17189_cov_23.034114_12_plen_75_part_00
MEKILHEIPFDEFVPRARADARMRSATRARVRASARRDARARAGGAAGPTEIQHRRGLDGLATAIHRIREPRRV